MFSVDGGDDDDDADSSNNHSQRPLFVSNTEMNARCSRIFYLWKSAFFNFFFFPLLFFAKNSIDMRRERKYDDIGHDSKHSITLC